MTSNVSRETIADGALWQWFDGPRFRILDLTPRPTI